ncbi:hypothetical protein BD779DRAFT_1674417 [Infundibulicybe gibba]|nr:hypothetical protein BD779DRAFT_1674417 [Infundibulicybe gibba]
MLSLSALPALSVISPPTSHCAMNRFQAIVIALPQSTDLIAFAPPSLRQPRHTPYHFFRSIVLVTCDQLRYISHHVHPLSHSV